MFGMAKAGSKKSATINQPSSTRIYKARILKVKSPASEGKFDASGASTFRVTGDHFWIAVTQPCKNNANMLNYSSKFLGVTSASKQTRGDR